jgi:phosphomannomutase
LIRIKLKKLIDFLLALYIVFVILYLISFKFFEYKMNEENKNYSTSLDKLIHEEVNNISLCEQLNLYTKDKDNCFILTLRLIEKVDKKLEQLPYTKIYYKYYETNDLLKTFEFIKTNKKFLEYD